MRRRTLFPLTILTILAAVPAAAQTPGGGEDAKITSALSAGPTSVTDEAAVMDWPSGEGAPMTELRPGTNGWACMPDNPSTPGQDPMCLDAAFQEWAAAWSGKTTPEIEAIGLGYMLAGGYDASNTDPFATEPAPGEDWIEVGPHVMVVVPDLSSLASIPTDPGSGGPWVMWKDTPYAHIMMPVGHAKGPGMHEGHKMQPGKQMREGEEKHEGHQKQEKTEKGAYPGS